MAGHVVLPWSHRAFSLLKRWAFGTYHGLRRKHIDTYLNEFVFRYNRRFYRHVSFEALLGLATHHEPTGYWDIIKRAGPPRPRLLHIDGPKINGITSLGRYFVKGDLSLTSIAGSGRRMVFSVEGGTTEVNCLVFMGSSFRRRPGCAWGAFSCAAQLNGMNPGPLFRVVLSALRTAPPHGPAAGPAIRPQPGRVSPGVTRRPRAVRSGQPSEGGEAEVPRRIGDLHEPCGPRALR